ncbi:MAG: hypothetical protein V4673_14320 [Pseudomonadota bacterium]
MQTSHSITWSIAHANGIKLSVAKCACGRFTSSGKRLSAADRRKSERLANEHLASVACVQPKTHAAE